MSNNNTTRMLIDASHEEETRVVIADEDQVNEFDFVTAAKQQIKGNIYLGKITRVEPSLQAAFVEYGGGKQAFLSFSEIHPDYYQIPQDDKQKLLQEELAEAEEEEAAEEAEEQEKEQKRGRRSRGGRNRGRRRGGNPQENESGEAAEENSNEDENSDSEDNAQKDDAKYAKAETPDEDSKTSSEPVSAEHDADEDDEGTETVGGDDVEEASARRKHQPSRKRRYKINEVIKRGQIVLMQAVKDERGNKGASVTTYISLAGRYCVLMPNSLKGGGISRKISGNEERKRLKEISSELKESRGLNMIIRTAGVGRTKAEIKRDYEYLVKLWHKIREDTMQATAPALIHEESNIIKRSIRDLYTSDVEEILVEGEAAYKEAKAFMKLLMPSHTARVKQYKDDLPIFSAHGVEEELMSIYDPIAKMPSGGYVVMHPTEALISIDVNSGRSTSERNVEETALKTNLEAAKEIARQLRLRDMAGLIVIDFIDMNYGKNRRTVEKAMKDALKDDRAKIQVARISTFGLMELSRQRLRPNIMEASAQECKRCGGTGFVRSVETVAIQVIRLIEKEATYNEYSAMRVSVTSDVAMHLLNDKRKSIQKIEEQYDIQIEIEIDNNISNGQYKIYKTDQDGKEVLHDDGKGDRKRRRRGGRGRSRNRDERDTGKPEDKKPDTESEKTAEPKVTEPKAAEAKGDEAKSDDENKGERKRTRGRRGGRGRNNKRTAEKEESGSSDANSSSDTVAPSETSSSEESEAPKKPKRTAKKADNDNAEKKAAQTKAPEEAPTAVPANSASALEEKPVTAKIETLAQPEEADGEKKRGWWSRVIEG